MNLAISKAHQSPVIGVVYTPLFEMIISVGIDQHVNVWDVHTGLKISQFKMDHSSALSSVAVDKRGKRLITGSSNGQLKVWNFHNGALMRQLEEGKGEITSIRCLASENHKVPIIGISTADVLLFWPDPSNDELLSKLNSGSSGGAHNLLCMDACETLIAVGTSAGAVLFWVPDQAQMTRMVQVVDLTTDDATVSCVLLITRPNGIICFVGSSCGTTYLIKTTDDLTVYPIETTAFPELILSATTNTRQDRLMVCDCVKTSRIWNLQYLLDITIDRREIPSPSPLPLEELQIALIEPFKLSNVTCCINCPEIKSFIIGSDGGDIGFWSHDGVAMSQLGQHEPWPYKRTGSIAHIDALASHEEMLSKGVTKAELRVAPRKVNPYAETNPLYIPPTYLPRGLRTRDDELESLLARHRAAQPPTPSPEVDLSLAESLRVSFAEYNQAVDLERDALRQQKERKRSQATLRMPALVKTFTSILTKSRRASTKAAKAALARKASMLDAAAASLNAKPDIPSFMRPKTDSARKSLSAATTDRRSVAVAAVESGGDKRVSISGPRRRTGIPSTTPQGTARKSEVGGAAKQLSPLKEPLTSEVEEVKSAPAVPQFLSYLQLKSVFFGLDRTRVEQLADSAERRQKMQQVTSVPGFAASTVAATNNESRRRRGIVHQKQARALQVPNESASTTFHLPQVTFGKDDMDS